jgi:SAM-dependent methyltransferase
MKSQNDRRRESFNDVAELYARARPPYPQALVDDLVAAVGLRPESRVLEIGCGTGLMTVPIAETSARILALELGAELAAVARGALSRFPAVEVIVADFDRWTPPPGPFDLVVIATAFHWLDPATRVAKCTAALEPGGTLAVVETHWGVGPTRDRFTIESQACYARWHPENAPNYIPPTLDALPLRTDELDRCAQLEPASLRRYPVERRYTTAQYRDLMATWSTVLTLDEARRTGLLDCISALIDASFGGAVLRHDSYSLSLARKA